MPVLTPRSTGILCILTSVLIWSGWMVLSSYGVRTHLTAYDLTAIRFATAGLVFLPVFLKRGMRIGPWGRWGAVWLALLMGASYNTICMIGFKFAPTSHASLIQTTVLLLSTLGGVWLLREKFTRLQAIGVAISVSGILFLLLSDDPVGHPDMWIGNLLFIIGGVMWTIYALSLRQWQTDVIQVAAAVCCVSAFMYLPVYFLFLPSTITEAPITDIAFQAVYQGLINSVIALLCYNRAVKLLGASISSTFLPLIPVIACLVAIPVLHELPTTLEWAGMLLAGVGVILATGVAGKLLKKRAHA